MLFILLLGLGALFLATTSGFFSVWGLAHTFPNKFWAVIAMGIALEYGKLIGVSFLYRFWDKVSRTVKLALFGPFVAITLALMAITAAGHYGYLSSGYQIDALPFKQKTEQIDLLVSEKNRRIDRKAEIDKQIAQLPSDFVRGRERLIRQFKDEQKNLTSRIDEIDKQILELKTEVLQSEVHAGQIVYIAKAFNLEIDQATNYLVLLIVCVFDPLAILLVFATNVAIRNREENNMKAIVRTSYGDFYDDFDKAKEGKGSHVTELPKPSWSNLPEPKQPAPPMPETKEPKAEDEEHTDVFSGEAPPGTKQMQLALDALNKKQTLSPKQLQTKARLEKILSEAEFQEILSSGGSSLNK